MINVLQAKHLIQNHERNSLGTCRLDEASEDLVKEIFKITDCLEPVGDDDRKALWIWDNKPSYEEYRDDYMKAYYYDDEEPVISDEEIEESYNEEYADDHVFYKFMCLHNPYGENDTELYGIFINGRYILSVNDRNADGYPLDDSELILWLKDRVTASVEAVRDGSYHKFVEKNLPYECRGGKILRKDLWDILPDRREDYLRSFDNGQIEKYLSYKGAYDEPGDYLPEMTARKFFEACYTGYAAVGYSLKDRECRRYKESEAEKEHYKDMQYTPKEVYCIFADGRDNGLVNVPMDDPKAFEDWYNDKGEYYTFNGNHPWEIISSFSLRYSLHFFVSYKKDKGYYYTVSGSAYTRSPETIRFYLALKEAGIPCAIREGEALAKRLDESDHIDILESWYSSFYGSSREDCLDVVTLTDFIDEENYEEIKKSVIEKAVWDAETPVKLK